MSRLRLLAAMAAALMAAAAAAGCGLGEGETSEGEATLSVTRDYGTKRVLEAAAEDPPESETVIRFLDREAEITTRYGGGFVQSIDGVAGAATGARVHDWFFFVNGVESSRGGAEVPVRGGDRIWWDYRDWTDALRTPAVVGSWPEPFAQASAEAEPAPVRVECAGANAPCERAAERLADEGVETRTMGFGSPSEEEAVRVLVGTWSQLGSDPLAGQLARGPATSGVFARFTGNGNGARLLVLDEGADEADRLGPGAGLVAALRRGEQPPAWVVTGTDAEGVEAAAGLLHDAALADRYAVAVADGAELPVPAPSEE